MRTVELVARPLVRGRVHPDAVTATGLLATAGAVAAAARAAPLAAGAAVLAAGVLDGLDGAVARLGGRGAAHGAALDRTADRVGEVGFAAALGLLGTPWQVPAAALALSWGAEAWRSGRRRSGRDPLPPTVGERPTRVLVVGLFCCAAGVLDAPAWAVAGAWVWVGTGVVALVQLATANRGVRPARPAR